MRTKILAAVAAATLAGGAFCGAAQAANLVVNGDFSASTLPVAALQASSHSGAQIGDDYIYGQALTGWNSAIGSDGKAFNLYFFGDGHESTREADTQYGELGQHPNANYSACSAAFAGCGGAFMVLDGDPHFTGVLSQTVSGLTVGKSYELSFYWAAGELADRTGFATSQLTGSFGGDAFATSVYANPNGAGVPGGFSGWDLVKLTFTAHTSSQLLSFLSVGTPDANLPPIALLDGVSVTPVPEPSVWAMMLVGFGAMGLGLRRRRRLAAA